MSAPRRQARRWDSHLSTEAQYRIASTLKGNQPAPGAIPLGTARPAAQYYPWDTLTTSAMNVEFHDNGPSIAHTVATSCIRGEEAFDLNLAMNYGPAAGWPPLLRFISEHVDLVHSPPYENWKASLTCGTTSALEMVFRMLCDRGEYILTEEYTYTGAVEAAKPLGVNVFGVHMDEAGLVPKKLDSILQQWDDEKAPKPTVLYTIPTGQNPTGVSQTAERRREIYEVAENHDLIIIEDDPYYFLQLGEQLSSSSPVENEKVRREEFLKRLPPSYLSIDVSGRVLRLDTTSKILAPGLRCGWMTGCEQLIDKFIYHSNFSTTSVSGPSQVMMYKLLVESWGHNGFIDWLIYLSEEYSRRLRVMTEACRAQLPADVCQWTVPSDGMFLWVRIDCSMSCSGLRPLEIEEEIFEQAKSNGVQVCKGSWFATAAQSQEYIYFRLTFAAASEASLEEAVKRLGSAITRGFVLSDREGTPTANEIAMPEIVVAA